jgi:hypothetical protein
MKNRLKKGMLSESASEVDASEKPPLKERMTKVEKQSDWASRRMKPTTLSTIQKQEQVLSNTRIKVDINSLNGRKLESRNKQPQDVVDLNPFGDYDEDDNDKNEINCGNDTKLDHYHDNDDVNDITISKESGDLVLNPSLNNETGNNDNDNDIDNDSHGNTNGYNDSNDNSDDFNDADKNKQELEDNMDTDRLSTDSSNEYNENNEHDSNSNYDDKNDNSNLEDIDDFDTDDYNNNNNNSEVEMQSQDSLQHLTNKPEGITVKSDKNYKNKKENENESQNLILNNHPSNHSVSKNPFYDIEEKEEVEISNSNSKKDTVFQPYLNNKNKPIQINSVLSISLENMKPLKSTYSPLYVPKIARQITTQKNNNNDKKNESFSIVDVDTIDIYEDENSRNFNLNTDFSSNPLNKIDESDVNLLYHKVMLSETWLYIALSIHICQFGVLLSLAQEVVNMIYMYMCIY